jgi:dihydrofolate synthase/folylpolyglutamate synthase
MTYPEAIARLRGLQMFGAKPGLERIQQMAEALGNPHRRLRFIHVAGTNGKGSTCAMLESIYRQTGLRTGLFTSPHLVAFSERIQVNRKPISETDVARITRRLSPLLDDFPQDGHPTFFEVVTAMALVYFAEQNCDLVIWETGLGGRLDATNIVTPLASIITNIHFDHEKWLGNTLAQIAFEKAGIIKPGVPAITGTDLPEPLDVIIRVARQKGAPLRIVAPEEARKGLAAEAPLPLLGAHQRRNAATAIAAVEVLQDVLPVSDAQLREGLARVSWPGRLQRIQKPDGRSFILDGAHNPAGIQALCDALQELYPGRHPALVVGILRDKDYSHMCQMLAPLAGRMALVNVHSERTAAAVELREACLQAHPKAEITCHPTLSEALASIEDEPLVVITGSLYLVGEALELLGYTNHLPADERSLNEWGGVPRS